MSFQYDVTVYPSSNTKHFIFASDGTSTGWITTPFTFKANKQYDYVCAYTDDRTISDIDALLNLIGVTTPYYDKSIQIDNIIKSIGLDDETYLHKRISILGDSISTFEGYVYPGNRCRYPQSDLLTDVNDTYWMRLINDFGLVLGVNESWAGSRITWDGSTESADIGFNKHIASTTRISHLSANGSPDIILVNGGTNDIGANVAVGSFDYENPMNYTAEQIANLPVDTFANAYRTMLIRLQTSYPNSRIFVLLPNYTNGYYPPERADAYCEVIKESCDYFGVKWVDIRASGITMFNKSSYLPDGIHYNSNGMKMIEKNIKKFMKYDLTI